MLKIHSLFITLSLVVLGGNACAQYTQMIVDNNNRIMPIFFHDEITKQQAKPFDKHQLLPTTQQSPKPVVLPSKVIKSRMQNRSIPRNPLTGPYFISAERHRVMSAAHASIGTPYIYGGNNPKRGLDCSSLMQFIHKQALGVSIPRTAAQQRKRSKTISYSNLQPGDMLFFKIDRRNNHVGIYIGEGKFIHASSSNKRATIASMNLPYWKKRFVKFGSYLDG